MIVRTEKVLREAGGPVNRRVERWSPLGALGRRPCAVQEPEDHKRQIGVRGLSIGSSSSTRNESTTSLQLDDEYSSLCPAIARSLTTSSPELGVPLH